MKNYLDSNYKSLKMTIYILKSKLRITKINVNNDQRR